MTDRTRQRADGARCGNVNYNAAARRRATMAIAANSTLDDIAGSGTIASAENVMVESNVLRSGPLETSSASSRRLNELIVRPCKSIRGSVGLPHTTRGSSHPTPLMFTAGAG